LKIFILNILGHGEYEDLPGEKELFDKTKKSERIVCHFYRDSTMRCKIVDKHLELLARIHRNDLLVLRRLASLVLIFVRVLAPLEYFLTIRSIN